MTALEHSWYKPPPGTEAYDAICRRCGMERKKLTLSTGHKTRFLVAYRTSDAKPWSRTLPSCTPL